MKKTMRKWPIVAVLMLVFAGLTYAAALQGPVPNTSPDVTCPNGSATIAAAASTPAPAQNGVTNQICVELEWISGATTRVGDANISASQGHRIAAAAGSNFLFCGDGAVYCWGEGGTSVLAITRSNRQ